MLQTTEARYSRQLAHSGVTALKHGRKGKPHPRHVRCTGSRLEWSRPDEKGRGYDKGIPLLAIDAIVGGLATDVAKRAGKGREELFLCVTSLQRSLDLEFPTKAARDEWWDTLEKWRAHVRAAATGGPVLPPPPSAQPSSPSGAASSSAAAAAAGGFGSAPPKPGSAGRLQVSPTHATHPPPPPPPPKRTLSPPSTPPPIGLSAGALVSSAATRSSPNPEAAA